MRSAFRAALWFVPSVGANCAIRAVSDSPASFTSASARLQPRRASDTAIARPMPLAEPVITAVRPSRFIALVIISRPRASAGYFQFLQAHDSTLGCGLSRGGLYMATLPGEIF